MAENTEKEIKVKSLQKALDILNCFTKKSTWGVTELSEYLDLNKSNVHRNRKVPSGYGDLYIVSCTWR